MTGTGDPYRVLGIPAGTDVRAVRRAYRRLALKYHPDKTEDPEGPAKFAAISAALEAILAGESPAVESTPAAPSPELAKRAQYFREKLFAQTARPHPLNLDKHIAQNSRLKRAAPVPKKCRTVRNGPTFDTVWAARHHVDVHGGSLESSYFESEWSEAYEQQTLERAATYLFS